MRDESSPGRCSIAANDRPWLKAYGAVVCGNATVLRRGSTGTSSITSGDPLLFMNDMRVSAP